MDAVDGAWPQDEPDAHSITREIALKALDRRAYGRAELGQYLLRKGACADVVERVLDRLAEVGLIDDEAYANLWVESRHRGRKLPRRALVAELRRKGLDEDIIASAVAPIDRDAEALAARALAHAKARAVTGQPYEVALRRLVGTLGRRGFTGEMAWAAAKEALMERGDVEPEMGA